MVEPEEFAADKTWQLDSLAQMLRAERVVHWQKELWQMHIQLLLDRSRKVQTGLPKELS